MADYIGTRCVVCNEKFTEQDDIVVCPECGTPYHRECYKKEGKCVNTALHESGGEWKPSYDVGDTSHEHTEEEICSGCGYKNPPQSLFCERCGRPLRILEEHNENFRAKVSGVREDDPQAYNRNNDLRIELQPFLINFSDPLCGYNPDEDFDGVRLCELADYVENNTHYYLPAFKRIKDKTSSIIWNLSATLFPELYFANRKMPLMALAAFLLRLIGMIPMFIRLFTEIDVAVLSEFAAKFDIRSTAFQILYLLSYAINYGTMFFCGAYANRIYYRHAVRKTAKIKAATPPQFLRDTLRRKGGTSAGLLVAAILLYMLPYVLIYMLTIIGSAGFVI